jgi:hypothetical protein
MFSPSLARLELSCLARIVHQNRLSTDDLDYVPLWNAARDLARLFQDLEGDRGPCNDRRPSSLPATALTPDERYVMIVANLCRPST